MSDETNGRHRCLSCGVNVGLTHAERCDRYDPISHQRVRMDDCLDGPWDVGDPVPGPSRAKTATEVMKSEQYDAPVDPWAHRSAKMRCRTCMWFVGKDATAPIKNADGEDSTWPRKVGRCRRHAPTMQGYPVVFEHDWCGDHRLDENKA